MAVKRIVPSLVMILGSTVVMQDIASAQDRGTAEQQVACTPDVFRLCSSQIPDVNRIVGCLRQNSAQLSSACRAVFDSNNSIPAPAPHDRVTPLAPTAPQPGPADDDN